MPFPNKSTQFQTGKSGNPTGRRRGAKSFHTRLYDAIYEQIWFLDPPPKSFVREYCRLYLKGKKQVKKEQIHACFESYLVWAETPKRGRMINR